ncbi:hypothetical protein Tco_0875060 [Tanacetum coccineum]|uniref:Uncharacterized protein n=1 Tax=Tanacetum coccineum TaxID=301880 RepID=A0ABQ5BQ50_9ASTR
MASFDYRLNPLYAIKECSSCGTLYTGDCGCSKGSLEDKILVPVPDLSQRPLKIENFCLDCGDPVHGLYCRQCALIRKTLEEVFQDFQDTSKSSDDDTNFVNQESFSVFSNSAPVDQIDDEVLENTNSIPPGIEYLCFNAKFDLLESLLHRDTSINDSQKIDSLLDEFAEFNSENPTESFSPSPIPVEDSDSLMEEIDIFLDGDDSIPPAHPPALSILDFNFIPFLNDLGSDLDVSSPSGDSNKIYDLGICIEVEATRFLSTLSPVINTLLPFSSENKDKVFNHSVLAS